MSHGWDAPLSHGWDTLVMSHGWDETTLTTKNNTAAPVDKSQGRIGGAAAPYMQ